MAATPTRSTSSPSSTSSTSSEAAAASAAGDAAPIRPRAVRPGSSALALLVAGALFVAYPAARPYADETALEGAAAMASGAWVASHSFGMLAFVLAAVGLRHLLAPRWWATTWAGVLLILPYYGAETWGLHAIGARAVADRDPALLAMADAVRYEPVAVTTFALGLLALGVAGVALVRAGWGAGGTTRAGAVLAGAGLALYLPQFFTPPGVRIAHGVLLGAGLVLLSAATWVRRPSARPRRT